MRAAGQHGVWLLRVFYRVRQFGLALVAHFQPLTPTEEAEVRAYLPASAWDLFTSMSAGDRRHSLNVLRAVRGNTEGSGGMPRPMAVAALLHDCAKHRGGVQIWHRVAVVLLRACAPGVLDQWLRAPAPLHASWRYPFWLHLHHPECGAELAAAAGCDPLAVLLIAHHQDHHRPILTGNLDADHWLPLLQAADDDN